MGERRRKSGRRMEKSLWVRDVERVGEEWRKRYGRETYKEWEKNGEIVMGERRRKSGRRMEKTLWERDVERVGEEWKNRYG